MAYFLSRDSYRSFRERVLRGRRFVRDVEVDQFLDALGTCSVSRVRVLPAGFTFWRAQKGHSWVMLGSERRVAPFPAPRMIPLPDQALEGRINPKGVACMYGSTSQEVALSEVRPWVGSVVSIAQFELTLPLSVVDCAVTFGASEGVELEIDQEVWADIDGAFSEPVTRSDRTAEYVPTQIIADLFRSRGWDGVLYRSELGSGGLNVALFGTEAVRQISCCAFTVNHVQYTYAEHSDS